jgi:hypothetical protein
MALGAFASVIFLAFMVSVSQAFGISFEHETNFGTSDRLSGVDPRDSPPDYDPPTYGYGYPPPYQYGTETSTAISTSTDTLTRAAGHSTCE